VWCLRSSFKKSKRWQQLKSNSNPPSSPFFKGGIVSVGLLPLFEKEGKGRFSDRVTRELCSELLGEELDYIVGVVMDSTEKPLTSKSIMA